MLDSNTIRNSGCCCEIGGFAAGFIRNNRLFKMKSPNAPRRTIALSPCWEGRRISWRSDYVLFTRCALALARNRAFKLPPRHQPLRILAPLLVCPAVVVWKT
jgi:hypothetical protein